MSVSVVDHRTVSVIIPAYNAEPFIREAILSVLAQESIREVIVIDDGSVDATAEIVSQFAERVTIIRHTRQGAAAARNAGIRVATGEYIAFLDADDLWMPGKIAKQLSLLSKEPGIDLVFGLVEEYADASAQDSAAVAKGVKVRGVMPGISPITLLARREVFLRVGEFSTDWSRGEFIDWYARAMECGARAHVIQEVLSRRRIHRTNSGRSQDKRLSDYAGVVAAALRRRRSLSGEKRCAPVVLMIFNRPEQTKRVFEAVRAAQPPLLFVIADGPREGVATDYAKVAAARVETEQIDWPCEVKRRYAPRNIGIKRSYDEGLAWVFCQCEEAIVLEDDCLPQKSFFQFCTELLERYRSSEQVMLISGMTLGERKLNGSEASYHFSRYALTWGWATWARAWKHYQGRIDYDDVNSEREWLSPLLPNRLAFDYWHYTFAKNASGYTHWDIAWARSFFRRNGIAIHPTINMITNIGFGEDATHARDARSRFSLLPSAETSFPLRHPTELVIDSQQDAILEERLFSGNLSRLFRAVRESFRGAETAPP